MSNSLLAVVREMKEPQSLSKQAEIDGFLVEACRKATADPVLRAALSLMSPLNETLYTTVCLYFMHRNDWTKAEAMVLKDYAKAGFVPNEAEIAGIRAIIKVICEVAKEASNVKA